MEALTLRLVLPPLIIAGATLAQGRLGDRLGGLVVGLPLTSGTFLGLLLLSHGQTAASEAAGGMLAGQIAVVVMGVAYAWLAPRTGVVAALVGTVATWAVALTLVHQLDGMLVTGLAYAAATGTALTLWPKSVGAQGASAPSPISRYGTVARVALGSGLVITLTAGVHLLGPDLAGTLAAAPLIALVLTPSTHRSRGADSVRALLQGVLHGSAGAATFAVVVAIWLDDLGGPVIAVAACAGLAGASLAAYCFPRGTGAAPTLAAT